MTMGVLMKETLRISGISMGAIFAVMTGIYAAVMIMMRDNQRK